MDSLYAQLSLPLSTDLRIDLLNELSWQLRKARAKEAKKYGQEALELALKSGDERRQATSLNRIGEVERLTGHLNDAAGYFEKALVIEKKMAHEYGMARALGQLCTVYKDLGYYREAEKAGLECLDLFKRIKKTPSVQKAYQRLAAVYQKLNQLDDALKMLEYKLELDALTRDSASMGNSLALLGKICYQKSSYDQALRYYEQSLEIWQLQKELLKVANVYTDIGNVFSRMDSLSLAEQFNMRSIRIKDSLGHAFLTALNYHNLGLIQAKKGNPDGARIFYKKSIAIKEKEGNKNGLALSFYNLGNLFKESGQTDSSLYYYEVALDLNPESPSLKMDIYWNLSDIYFETGNYERSNLYREYYGLLRDSIDVLLKEASRAQDNFAFEQQERLRLIKDNEIKQVQLAKRTQLVYFLLAGIVLLLMFFFFVIHYQRVRKNAIISEKNARISKQQVDEMLQKHEIKELGARLNGQEKERERIARELHDTLGSTLSIAKMRFRSVEENMNALHPEKRAQYEKASELLDQAVDEVRKISNEMISGVLYKFGLVSAVRNLVTSINESGQLKVSLIEKGVGDDRLAQDVENNTYRCIQELLSNALKHANASEVNIQLIRRDQRLHVQVEDDGVGFDVRRPSGGIGLRNIYARAEQLEAEVNMDSRPGQGTFVTMDIPIEHYDQITVSG